LCASPRGSKFGKKERKEANHVDRRTYGKGTGEDIREGYEPTDDVAAVDPKEDEGVEEGQDVEERHSADDSEESRQWNEAREPAVVLQPKYGLDGEAFENVWGEASTQAREHP
jgi:hypothetical protein